MNSAHNISSSVYAKVMKRLPWWICMLFIPAVYAHSQSTPNAIFDAQKNEIFLFSGQDSLASIPLDKSFYATLNHEKKRKKKTIYYRLARYSNPIYMQQVPVVIANNYIQLHLTGTLQGDTSAKFSCIISVTSNQLLMEVQVPDISVNELHFQLKPISPNKTITISNLDQISTIDIKKIRKYTNVTLHGFVYNIQLLVN